MYFWQVLKSLNCQWIFQTRYISQHNSNFYSYHIYSTDYCIHTIFIPQTTIFIPYLFHRLLQNGMCLFKKIITTMDAIPSPRKFEKQCNKHCEVKHFILTSMYAWHVGSRWYILDLHSNH